MIGFGVGVFVGVFVSACIGLGIWIMVLANGDTP